MIYHLNDQTKRISDERSLLAGLWVFVSCKHFNDIREDFRSLLVEVGDGDACGESGEIRVTCRERGGRLSSQLVQFYSSYSRIHSLNNFLGDDCWFDMSGIETI